MLFDTPIYFLFLVPVVLAYWRLNHRAQNVFLLLASYFFYGWWDWRFLALMIGATTADFFIAHKVAPGRLDPSRRHWLVLSLVLNLTILGIFKYFNFFVDSFVGGLNQLGFHHIPLPLVRIILPPGISFYTFEEIAYIVDVYKGRVEPSKSFLDYSLYISLFPHLIAGPIQRPGSLLPQIQNPRSFEADRIFDGLMLIFSGLIRKCVFADNCAVLANAAFGGQWGAPSFWVVLIGTYAFAWQVYGDFSGYTDIARGSAQLLGFHFMINFRQPFLSQSLQELWRRWHISLSTWLRDYLYIPLGGNRDGNWKTCRNLLITMLLGGLWHGANWTFIVFGGIHGVVLSAERFFLPARRKSLRPAILWSEATKNLLLKVKTSRFLSRAFRIGMTGGGTLMSIGGPKAHMTLPKKSAEEDRPDDSANFLSVWTRRILIFNVFCLSLAFFRSLSLSAAVQFLGGLFHFAWRTQYGAALVMLCVFSFPLFFVDLLLEARNQEYPFAEAPYAVRTAVAVVALVVLAFFSGSKFSTFVYFQF